MCGRFVVTNTVQGLMPTLLEDGWTLPESYNLAPTQDIPVVRVRDGERELASARWAIVPPRATEPPKGRPVFNARLETVDRLGMFAGPFAHARCIVPALGYYEWTIGHENGREVRQPHFIHDPGHGLAMAGIVRAWRSGVGDRWALSAAIITRDAHVAPGEVHDRMPACLTPEAYEAWLAEDSDPGEMKELLEQTSLEVAHELEHYPVSRRVNSSDNDGPDLIEPLR